MEAMLATCVFAERTRRNPEILKNATPERIEASFHLEMQTESRNYRWKSKFTKPSQNDFDFETTSKLNFKIAQNSITKIKDNHNTVTVLMQKNREDLAN
jgi:hypothetical protein